VLARQLPEDTAMELDTPHSHSLQRQTDSYRNVGDSDRKISLVAGAGSMLYGLTRGGMLGLALTAVGGLFVYRGLSGHCPMFSRMGYSTARPSDRGLFGEQRGPLHFTTGVTIQRSPEELYDFWHGFTHLPRFMKFIRDVRPSGGDRTHWVAEIPGMGQVEWESEVVRDVPNESISWRSVEGSEIPQEGEIRFRRAPDGKGTEVELDMRYEPPAGRLGRAFGGLLNVMTKEAAREDLRRFKRLMETGEIPTGSSQTADVSQQPAPGAYPPGASDTPQVH
jgi:uncharacterized membrane protein